GRARVFGSAVVDVLEGGVDRVVGLGLLEQRDDRLQVVAALGADAHLVALDLGLDALGELVADQLGDLLGDLAAQALLDGAGELVLLAGGLGLAVAEVERLERDAAAEQLGLEDVDDRLDALGGVRLHDHGLARPRDRGADVAEVVALRDLLRGLVERVVDLLPVDLAHDVERAVSHPWLLSSVPGRQHASADPSQACYPSIRSCATPAGYPSGQRELTVNQPRNASGVRIPHPPPPERPAQAGRSPSPGARAPAHGGPPGPRPRPHLRRVRALVSSSCRARNELGTEARTRRARGRRGGVKVGPGGEAGGPGGARGHQGAGVWRAADARTRRPGGSCRDG